MLSTGSFKKRSFHYISSSLWWTLQKAKATYCYYRLGSKKEFWIPGSKCPSLLPMMEGCSYFFYEEHGYMIKMVYMFAWQPIWYTSFALTNEEHGYRRMNSVIWRNDYSSCCIFPPPLPNVAWTAHALHFDQVGLYNGGVRLYDVFWLGPHWHQANFCRMCLGGEYFWKNFWLIFLPFLIFF